MQGEPQVMKKNNYIKDYNRNTFFSFLPFWVSFLIILFSLFSFIYFGSLVANKMVPPTVYSVTSSFYENLDRIQLNCGSTFITKKFGEQNYSVYRESCTANNYCKNYYTPIEECLK